MAAKGYCTTDEVAAFLSRALTEAQVTQLEKIIEAAEQWIDDQFGYGYLGSPVLGKYRVAWARQFYLGPIASVESIRYYDSEEDSPYTIVDLGSGRIALSYGAADGTGFLVDYTPSQAVPAKISRACIVLSAHWLMPTLDPDRFGVAQHAFSGDYSVTYSGDSLPKEVFDLLGILPGGDLVLA